MVVDDGGDGDGNDDDGDDDVVVGGVGVVICFTSIAQPSNHGNLALDDSGHC